MAVTLNIESPELLDSAMKMYGITEKAVNIAEVRAMNKTLKWLVSQMARSLSGDLGLAQKKIRERIRFSYASTKTLKAEFWFGAYNIALAKFGKGRAVGTGYAVKRKQVDGGFLATMRSGHTGVFYRKGKARLPIKEAMTVIESDASKQINRLYDRAEVELKKRLTGELETEMRRAMGSF